MRTSTVIVAALVSGVVYYTLIRQVGLPDPSAGTYPSFIHAFTTVLALLWCCSRIRLSAFWRWTLPAVTAVALTVLELSAGTADVWDLLAAALGSLLALAVWRWRPARLTLTRLRDTDALPSGAPPALPLLAVAATSVILATASLLWSGEECVYYDDNGNCNEYAILADPIYMSYAVLRGGAIRREAPRPPTEIGGVYRFGDYLLVNERNQGIHIVDNRDPFNPVNRAFLRVPGNTQAIIRGQHLYVDSFTDLVTLDFGDIDNVVESSRHTDAFPWDAYQAVPYNVRFFRQPDRSAGVVVSYSER